MYLCAGDLMMSEYSGMLLVVGCAAGRVSVVSHGVRRGGDGECTAVSHGVMGGGVGDFTVEDSVSLLGRGTSNLIRSHEGVLRLLLISCRITIDNTPRIPIP